MTTEPSELKLYYMMIGNSVGILMFDDPFGAIRMGNKSIIKSPFITDTYIVWDRIFIFVYVYLIQP